MMLKFFSIKEQKRELELSVDRQRKRLYKNEFILEQRYWILERNMILNLKTENMDLRLKIETDERNLSHLNQIVFLRSASLRLVPR
jgi:hypothetical protein